MNKSLIAILAVLVFSPTSAASFAASPLPRHAPPGGFRSIDRAAGGRLLAGTLRGPFANPYAALAPTMHRLRAYFSGPLPVSGAVASHDQLMVFFRGRVVATPVAGVTVIALTHDGGAAVESFFDTPQRAGASLRKFAAMSRSAGGPPAGTANVALTRQRFPDGSGTIGVPDGWRIAGANRGMVDLVGPDGAEAHIAIEFPIWDPRAGFADPTRMQLPFIADPVAALKAVTKRVYATRNASAPAADIFKASSVTPPMGSGRAALVYGQVHAARPLDFVTLVNSTMLSGSAWMFYATTLSAPPRRFAQDYPLMLAVWKSYRVDAAYERSVQADTAITLRAAANIINGATQRAIVAQDQTNAGMDNIVNGNEILERLSDGSHHLGNADAARALADQYPDRYRVVPTNEYRSGDY